jgi:hypothetical protein
MGPGSVMNAMSRTSPPHPGHSCEHASPTRAISLAQTFGMCRTSGAFDSRHGSLPWRSRLSQWHEDAVGDAGVEVDMMVER